MDVQKSLSSLGLSRYERAFRSEADILPDLTDAMPDTLKVL